MYDKSLYGKVRMVNLHTILHTTSKLFLIQPCLIMYTIVKRNEQQYVAISHIDFMCFVVVYNYCTIFLNRFTVDV